MADVTATAIDQAMAWWAVMTAVDPPGTVRSICTTRDDRFVPAGHLATDADLAQVAERLGAYALDDLWVSAAALTADVVGRGGRGDADDAAAVGALWLDIDTVDVAHHSSGRRLFADQHEAEQFVAATCPVPPTMTVWTGHGLHYWWALAEPLTLPTRWRCSAVGSTCG